MFGSKKFKSWVCEKVEGLLERYEDLTTAQSQLWKANDNIQTRVTGLERTAGREVPELVKGLTALSQSTVNAVDDLRARSQRMTDVVGNLEYRVERLEGQLKIDEGHRDAIKSSTLYLERLNARLSKIEGVMPDLVRLAVCHEDSLAIVEKTLGLLMKYLDVEVKHEDAKDFVGRTAPAKVPNPKFKKYEQEEPGVRMAQKSEK